VLNRLCGTHIDAVTTATTRIEEVDLGNRSGRSQSLPLTTNQSIHLAADIVSSLTQRAVDELPEELTPATVTSTHAVSSSAGSPADNFSTGRANCSTRTQNPQPTGRRGGHLDTTFAVGTGGSTLIVRIFEGLAGKKSGSIGDNFSEYFQ
jgi:hypothetical protein